MGLKQRKDQQRVCMRRRLVLLVDTHSEDPFALQAVLQQFGYNVCAVASTQEAVEIIQIAVPSLVVIDPSGPEDEGLELLFRIRENRGCAKVPVIMVSKRAHRPVADAARSGVLDALVRKPVQTDELFRVVQKAMERYPRVNIRILTNLRAVQGDAEGREGQATELSEEGMFFQTDASLSLQKRFPMRLWTDEREIRVEAEVLYRSYADGPIAGRRGIGMKFVKIRPEDQTYLRAFIMKQINVREHVI